MSVILTDLSPEALAAREQNALAEFGAFVKEFDEKLAPYGAQTRLSLIWNDRLPERPPVKPGYRCSVRCELVRNGEPILKDPFSPSPEPIRTEWMIVYVYQTDRPNACGYSVQDEDVASDMEEMLGELAVLNGEAEKPEAPEVIGGVMTKGEYLGWSFKDPSQWNKREKRYFLQLAAAIVAPVLGLVFFFINRRYGKYALILAGAYFVWVVIVRNIYISRRAARLNKQKKR